MRQLIILIPLLFTVTLYGQKGTATRKTNSDTTNLVSFIAKFDKTAATKDGYYLGGYVVNISYEQSKSLDGKTIKITGKVSIEKGLDSDTPKDTGRISAFRQGRAKDTKHIESPTIEIIKNKN